MAILVPPNAQSYNMGATLARGWNGSSGYWYTTSGGLDRFTFSQGQIPAGYLVYQVRAAWLAGNGWSGYFYNGATYIGGAGSPVGAAYNGSYNDINYPVDTGWIDVNPTTPITLSQLAANIRLDHIGSENYSYKHDPGENGYGGLWAMAAPGGSGLKMVI